ncbi:gliding motility-associated-like protein [Flavobacterium sp. 1]|uniref:DUF7948 domain-containing protein n=1 Tax=Flavobacterium sp. 1 TaxID=2035200 RepID=UPI000C233BBE|nr:T9SS type B sorting domain-containing protein [Flavobacterium sp. 1]PJJ07117.1 gliding motility-associated-like protein [Flavobacterium sp. 1]
MNLKLLFFITLITISSVAQNKNKTIGFKENKGQIIDQKGKPNNAVKYLLNSGGLNIQLRKNGFSYDVYEAKKNPVNHSHDEKKKPLPFPSKDNENLPNYTLEYQFHRIDIDFLNSNPKVELITEEKSLDYDNYYNIPNKPEGVLMVYQYKQITYKNIYPNIDVVFSMPKDTLKTVEYNFVVHPKGKISDIQLKFSGVQTELVDNKIRMSVRFGEMEETLPMSWTEDGELKKEIPVGYTKIKKNVYGFESAENVSDKTVIIDPVPTRLWGTFYGGADWTESNTIDKDDLGNIYFAGKTASVSTIATAGSHQSSAGFIKIFGSITYDGYISKFDSNGNRLWATYYGGNYDDYIKSIKVTNSKDLVFCGNTNSLSNISTAGSFKENKSGSYSEMFLGKLNSNGIRQWATYYGNDNGLTFANSIAVDEQNSIYLSGATTSDEFISTPNSFKETRIDNNRFDGFLAKFDTNGNRIWGTYFGGDKDDSFEDSAIDKDGNIILVGYSQSENDIATTNSYQPTYHLGDLSSRGDGMIVKFNPNGQRIWSTYFGDKNSDWIYNCKIYKDNLYIVGKTENNNISTPNAFDPIMKVSYRSSYFAKFNLTMQKLTWLSYSLGNVTSIYPKNDNEIYITGESTYGFDIACPNAYNPINSTFSGFIIKLDENCKKNWGTYFSKTSLIRDPIIISEGTNNIFVTGIFNGFPDNDIASPGAYQDTPSHGMQGFLIKFQDSQMFSNPLASSNSPICIGANLNLKASGGTNYAWTGPNGFTSTDQNPTIPNATALNSGQYSCNITGSGGCDGVLIVDVIIGDTVAPIPNLTTLQTITGDCHTSITTIPTATDACVGEITATTTSPLSYNLPGTYTIVWNYDDGNRNISHQNQTVTISDQPLPTATTSQTFCIQQNATLTDIMITGQNLKWYDVSSAGNVLTTTTALENKTYYASQTNNSCESNRLGIVIKIQDTQTPIADAYQSFCIQQNVTINTIKINGQNIKWYDAITNGANLSESTPLENGITYYASQTISNCESERTPITVKIQEATTADCINLIDVLPYPKFFTPNNDGFNDHWTIDFAYLAPKSTIRIFDRYGKLIKELTPDISWDGNYQNLPLPSTDYWFVVTRLNGTEFKSHFSLKR